MARAWPTRGREQRYVANDGYYHVYYELIWPDGRITAHDDCLYIRPEKKEDKPHEKDHQR